MVSALGSSGWSGKARSAVPGWVVPGLRPAWSAWSYRCYRKAGAIEPLPADESRPPPECPARTDQPGPGPPASVTAPLVLAFGSAHSRSTELRTSSPRPTKRGRLSKGVHAFVRRSFACQGSAGVLPRGSGKPSAHFDVNYKGEGKDQFECL